MKKRMIAIAAATMATMMMATPVLAEDYKIGICNYVDDASLNQIVDNLESRLKEIGDEKGVNFDISYDNCNADANVMEQIISDFQADGVDLMVGVDSRLKPVSLNLIRSGWNWIITSHRIQGMMLWQRHWLIMPSNQVTC